MSSNNEHDSTDWMETPDPDPRTLDAVMAYQDAVDTHGHPDDYVALLARYKQLALSNGVSAEQLAGEFEEEAVYTALLDLITTARQNAAKAEARKNELETRLDHALDALSGVRHALMRSFGGAPPDIADFGAFLVESYKLQVEMIRAAPEPPTQAAPAPAQADRQQIVIDALVSELMRLKGQS